jgi:hypothetical protein
MATPKDEQSRAGMRASATINDFELTLTAGEQEEHEMIAAIEH